MLFVAFPGPEKVNPECARSARIVNKNSDLSPIFCCFLGQKTTKNRQIFKLKKHDFFVAHGPDAIGPCAGKLAG
ncbi:hypothetical protein [Phytopseudomonas dryadis]|uniref:hypothetical protein n=1 Tax=Phytopseudomonas dryadis TaxID=2487520 RepID=UPI001038371D|nr:hypothetical protein [Pseudomonas dryadis]